MSWKALREFTDPAVPKLFNLALADKASIAVPTTWWCEGSVLEGQTMTPPPGLSGPMIVRSGSPTEDTEETSNAGQLLSLVVPEGEDFADAVRQVVEALPKEGGERLGVAFVQPLLHARHAGVAFFDGFYWEKSVAEGNNEAITSGTERGETSRGHYEHFDPWSEWLVRIYATLSGARGAHDAIDIEFCDDDGTFTLLQSRPALFRVRRNPTVSLANHREILGEVPSPWIVSAMTEGGTAALSLYTDLDDVVASWEEPYAYDRLGRCWMNITFFYRLTDRLGMPRERFVKAMGGRSMGPPGQVTKYGLLARHTPYMTRLAVDCFRRVRALDAALAAYDADMERCPDELPALFDLTARGMTLALKNTFAINTVLSLMAPVRKTLGLRASADVITHDMMDDYETLRTVPEGEREAGLDRWLAEFGHRGPLETDVRQPRFREMRDVLLADLMAGGATTAAESHRNPSSWWAAPLYRIDERREWFRDQVMRRWSRLRPRILAAADKAVQDGLVDAVDDVFWLRGDDFRSDRPWRESIAANREQDDLHQANPAPHTSALDDLDGAAAQQIAGSASDGVFHGIPLSDKTVEGKILRGTQLTEVLQAVAALDGEPRILLVPALEPSWAVAFGRFAGVVTELGGEMSHASILLREAARPAVVNCQGIFAGLKTGDRVRLDGKTGTVVRLEEA